MVKEDKSASQILLHSVVTPRPDSVDVVTYFSDLVVFKESLRKAKGKPKLVAPCGSSKPKKSKKDVGNLAIESTPKLEVDSNDRLPKKDEERLLKSDVNKFKAMYTFGTEAVSKISVSKIMEARLIFVYRSVNGCYSRILMRL
ncbi:hypothetical protein R1sor_008937 [Riccia sorocarpa]|uniref:Uncharacterized protein n=1 Tax=Riccia sorocarpa TaxID=122646 RepID=A0ABD3H4Z7_9MARC